MAKIRNPLWKETEMLCIMSKCFSPCIPEEYISCLVWEKYTPFLNRTGIWYQIVFYVCNSQAFNYIAFKSLLLHSAIHQLRFWKGEEFGWNLFWGCFGRFFFESKFHLWNVNYTHNENYFNNISWLVLCK